MILTYSPEGEDAMKWNIRFKDFRRSDADEIQKLSGMKFGPFQDAVSVGGDASALAVLVFVMLRKTHPVLRFQDFDPRLGDMDLSFDADELAQVREKLVADGADPDTLARLDEAMADAEPALPKA